METIYIKGNDTDFVLFVKSFGNKAELTGIDGHFRWVITEEGKEPYIVRPESSKP